MWQEPKLIHYIETILVYGLFRKDSVHVTGKDRYITS